MFDIGFSEIFVIAVVALLVLGPERLPKAARFAGLWVRRARAQWYSVKAELETELADEELRRSLRQAQEQLRAAEAAMREQAASLEQGARGLAHDSGAPGSSASGAEAGVSTDAPAAGETAATAESGADATPPESTREPHASTGAPQASGRDPQP